jgi:hypothetical protein
MSNATVTANITRRNVELAIEQARSEAANHRAWANAIERAEPMLLQQQWQFDGDTLVIRSASSMSRKYTVTGHGCDCKAGRDGIPCKHRAARRLLVKASELATTPAPTLRKSAAQVEQEAAELFG